MISEGDIIKVILNYIYPGASEALNIFYWVYGGLDKEDAQVLDDLEEFYTDQWGAEWSDLADDNSELENMVVQVVGPDGAVLRDIGLVPLNISGDLIAGSVSPAAVAGYIQGDTAVPRVMGRKYVPAIREESLNQGEFDAAGLVTLGLMLLDYVTRLDPTSGGSFFPGVVSAKEGDFVPFQTSGLIESIPAYQRRRKRGVGT